jgi:hypothetical protein
MCFRKKKIEAAPELFQEKPLDHPVWISVDFPPDHSCRVLVCFEEIDSMGARIISTGTFIQSVSGFVIDDFQARFFPPYKYVERDHLNVPE